MSTGLFNCFVINVETNFKRRKSVETSLDKQKIQFNWVKAITPTDTRIENLGNLQPVARAVWESHLKCLKLASESSLYSLILEDDSEIKLSNSQVLRIIDEMKRNRLDFMQIGFLHLHIVDVVSIHVRNFHNLLLKKRVFGSVLSFFGFQEGIRSKNQYWRSEIPSDFILNDIRYGAHAYIISPQFSKRISQLNSPTFLAADDFFVSLGKMKSFRMARLRKSLVSQGSFESSFDVRYGIDLE